MSRVVRCGWVPEQDPLYVAYHDEEWGVPCYDDTHLFEMLLLEGAQAGLSWTTILHRREGYRRAFAGFDALRIAEFGAADVQHLLQDTGIVRNRLKILAAISNARVFLDIREQPGGLAGLLWKFVDGHPRQNTWRQQSEVPASSPESEALSRELKHRGCRFVGPIICYALMQAVGMVNDHTSDCFRCRELGGHPP